MSQLPRARANAAQRSASDPAVSAFVSASAGSGKTKLLTDRLLRLLLQGAAPGRIQCLTYTNAAAAEMALRLRQALSIWATCPDAELVSRLRALDEAADPATIAIARAAFARVLDEPGGLRVETIHAFCQSLLRRFPLEAAVSPRFRLLGDADAETALLDAQEAVLEAADPAASLRAEAQAATRAAIAEVAGAVGLGVFHALARTLAEDRDRLAGLLPLGDAARRRLLRRVLRVEGDATSILTAAAAWLDEPAVRQTLQRIAAKGPAKAAALAYRRLDWLSLAREARVPAWDTYACSWLNQKGGPLAPCTIIGKNLALDEPWLCDVVAAEQERILAVQDALRAERAMRLSVAFLALALPMAERYADMKRGAARLDYADLIEGTTGLLRDPGAAWVLHKLDGGLDHLLLDEVQDTPPGQWAIAGALVAEFFAGRGARDVARSVFAVGDRKQSIFSFQGAAPHAFDDWQYRLERLATGAGRIFRKVSLDVSFRSTAPVLALADAVFADPLAARGVAAPGTLRHVSDREGQAGSVELWPLEPRPERTEPPHWDAPHRRTRTPSAPQRLAERVADWIADAVSGGVSLPSRGRDALPGDILILVRRRDAMARAIVRALKHKGVPVAGVDRMKLTEQPAVADLLALCDALLLPSDDLAVACVLTSPLGGLDDDDLIALAPGRAGPLWDELRRRSGERPGWSAAWSFLASLFARTDHATPHALLAEALGRLGGRARLMARMGAEAAEPIDEMLAAALAYAAEHPPSLQGFVHWLRRSAAEVKRQAEGAGGDVRLMTVHGAKGLQAPIVILPDTSAPTRESGGLLWGDVDGTAIPVWAPAEEWRSAVAEDFRQAQRGRDTEESNRLLYVALTRAEDRAIVCGFQTSRPLKDDCWYRLVERGMVLLGAAAGPLGLRHESGQSQAPDRSDRRHEADPRSPLPEWAGSAPDWTPAPPPDILEGPVRLAPSRPRDAGLGLVPASLSPLARTRSRFERGRMLHALLQHLPEIPAPARDAAAGRFLAMAGLTADEAAAARADVLAVLSHPVLAAAFANGSRAEVPLTGLVGGQVVAGLVDRLAVMPDGVLIVDYKTNRRPPEDPADIPPLYARQMAAYRAVLQAVHPDRVVRCLLVWTEGARVMELPPDMLDGHAPGSA